MSDSNRVAIVGLGYVGLTLATVMAERGFKVTGTEKRKDVVKLVRAGYSHFEEKGLAERLQEMVKSGRLKAVCSLLEEAAFDAYIITVGTPLDPSTGRARMDNISNTAREIADHMDDGALVILRSTVKIGTTRGVVAPILEQSGKQFHLSMCPERTLEGNALNELYTLPQICSGDSVAARARSSRLFQRITNTVIEVSSLEAAETIKLVDNTWRDVQFGFANEVARLCDAFGISASEVIEVGKRDYARTNVARPGLVGGPCLEKDPHILNESAQTQHIELEITKAARKVNERQPIEIAQFIRGELCRRQLLDSPTIALLGMAFKGVPETSDLRGSMSIKILEQLQKYIPELIIRLFDPVICSKDLQQSFPGLTCAESIEDAIDQVEVAVICNNHPFIENTTISNFENRVKKDGFIFDCWNTLVFQKNRKTTIDYFSIGNSGGITLYE